MQSDYKLADTLREEANRSEWADIRAERAERAEAEARGRAYQEQNDKEYDLRARYAAEMNEVLWLLDKLPLCANLAQMPLLEAYAGEVLRRIRGDK